MAETKREAEVQAIADRYEGIRARIAAACARAGRRAEEVTVVAVSKTFPLPLLDAAYDAGLRHFGENKVQEFVEKATARPGLSAGGDRHWHFIGHLQRNKAKEVVAHADQFHALDSLRLAQELEKRAGAAGRVLPCLVQVNVSGEESKFGLGPAAVTAFLGEMAAFPHLAVRGLMTLAAPADDPETVRPQFRLLRTLFDRYATTVPGEPMTVLSMGMSDDFEVAVEEGATHVRIGSALFGDRRYD